jgi:DNA repair protein RadC
MAARKYTLKEIEAKYGIELRPSSKKVISTPAKAFPHVWKALRSYNDKNQEAFAVLMLDYSNCIVDVEVVTVGILNKCPIHPREVFKKAISLGVNSIMVSHNHPSGALKASDADLELTSRMAKAGNIIGIDVLDHIIVSSRGYSSIKLSNGELFEWN